MPASPDANRRKIERKREIARLWRAGVSTSEIVHKVQERIALEGGKPLSVRTIKNDIQEAVAEMKSEYAAERPNLRLRRIAQADMLFQRALAKGDHAAAARAIDLAARIEGLYAPVEIRAEHGGTVQHEATIRVAAMTTTERRRRIHELSERLGIALPAGRASLPGPASDATATSPLGGHGPNGTNGHGNGVH